MTALSPAVDVGIIGDGPVAASLAACLVQAGIDCGSARRSLRCEMLVNVSKRRTLLSIRLDGGSRTESSTNRLS